jgi:hypothetical protein
MATGIEQVLADGCLPLDAGSLAQDRRGRTLLRTET